MKRYLILGAAFLMQMCLGSTYAWSVFVRAIRDLTGLSQGITQSPFTVFFFAFPLTLIFSGSIMRRLGPGRSAMTGALLFGLGWAIAGFGGGQSFGFVIAGIGLVGGVGVGFAYMVPIAVCNKWFPERPGLVTGIAVAGFAFGAGLVGMCGEMMMAAGGMTAFESIGFLGIIFLVLGLPAASRMEFPERALSARDDPPRRSAILRTPEFRQLFPAMVAGLAAGFAANSNLKDISAASGMDAGVTAVSVFAVGSASGRIVWGWIFDRMLPSSAIRLNLFAQSAVLGVMFMLVRDTPTLLLFAAGAGFNYGGVLVLYASAAARRWGLTHLGQVYGLLFAANIAAAPAAMIAGFSLDVFGSFRPAFLVLASLLVAGALGVRRRVDKLPPTTSESARQGD
jgi:OFA family oxalate/formate antiporter-like MFS transporter